jgi:hypothetical protein
MIDRALSNTARQLSLDFIVVPGFFESAQSAGISDNFSIG